MAYTEEQIQVMLDFLSLKSLQVLFNSLRNRIEDVGEGSCISPEAQQRWGWLDCPAADLMKLVNTVRDHIQRRVAIILNPENDPKVS